ncbi:MAG: cobalt transporter CbiM [Candidatus Schekmanbacteria bacterium]|nr:cobalt transporter CbiM [Candidatus Schekmanbacteria bacterium]
MHISDGVLPTAVWAGSYAVSVGLAAFTARKIKPEELPKIAVITSVFFVASLIHIPLGPASVHLLLTGLVGIILGAAAFPSILLGLLLQALLFQHGGITSLGANALMMGIPALTAYGIFTLRHRLHIKNAELIFGIIAGAGSTMLSGIILAVLLISAGENFIGMAKYVLWAHVPVMLVEGAVVGCTARFLARVKPEILDGRAIEHM